MEAAAALAARIRVDNEGIDIDPDVRSLLDGITAELAVDGTTSAHPVHRSSEWCERSSVRAPS